MTRSLSTVRNAYVRQLAFAAHPNSPALRANSALCALIAGMRGSLRAAIAPSLVSLNTQDESKAFSEVLLLASSVEQTLNQIERRSTSSVGRIGYQTVNNLQVGENREVQEENAPAVTPEGQINYRPRAWSASNTRSRGGFQNMTPRVQFSQDAPPNRFNPRNQYQNNGRYPRSNSGFPQKLGGSMGNQAPFLGHTSASYVARGQQRQSRTGERECWRCASKNHLFRDCRAAPAAQVDGPTSNRVASVPKAKLPHPGHMPFFF